MKRLVVAMILAVSCLGCSSHETAECHKCQALLDLLAEERQRNQQFRNDLQQNVIAAINAHARDIEALKAANAAKAEPAEPSD